MDKLKKTTEDIVIMILFLLGCAYMWFFGIPRQIPESNAAKGQYFTPSTFPYCCVAVLALCSVIGLLISISKYRKLKHELQPDEEKSAAPTGQGKKTQWLTILMPFIVYLLLIAYLLFIEKAGFILATVVIPPILLFLLGCRKWYFYIITYAFSGVMYLLFTMVLHVHLP